MKDLKNISIRETKDGSTTLYVADINETYHSSHGAMQEAKHVFIMNGLELLSKDCIHVLEVGFGTGLNALLTSDFSVRNKQQINYVGLETVPLKIEIIDKLNYLEYEPSLSKSFFLEIHSSDWEKKNSIHEFLTIEKINSSVQEFVPENDFDIVFYDAFGPRAQSEMWEKEIFEKLYGVISNNGILVTYCAMGQFKRDLKSVGFTVKNVPGPPGKREMTIAIKE